MKIRMNVLFIGMNELFIYSMMQRNTNMIFLHNGASLLLLTLKQRMGDFPVSLYFTNDFWHGKGY